jgi:hypothetical protein
MGKYLAQIKREKIAAYSNHKVALFFDFFD